MNEHKHDSSHHFIVPVAYYVRTFIALLILTFITVWISRFDFGSFNIVVAMIIAVMKASLVCSVFMGLRWDKGIFSVFFMGSFVFLGIFITLTMSDIVFRHDADPLEAQRFGFKKPLNFIEEKPAAAAAVAATPATANASIAPKK